MKSCKWLLGGCAFMVGVVCAMEFPRATPKHADAAEHGRFLSGSVPSDASEHISALLERFKMSNTLPVLTADERRVVYDRLIRAIYDRDCAMMVKFLELFKLNPNRICKDRGMYVSPLGVAALVGDPEIVALLLNHGGDPIASARIQCSDRVPEMHTAYLMAIDQASRSSEENGRRYEKIIDLFKEKLRGMSNARSLVRQPNRAFVSTELADFVVPSHRVSRNAPQPVPVVCGSWWCCGCSRSRRPSKKGQR